MPLQMFHRNSINANTMVRITEEGKRAIDQQMVNDMRQFAVLAALDNHSPQSLSALAKEARASIYAVESVVRVLKGQGFVTYLDYNKDGQDGHSERL